MVCSEKNSVDWAQDVADRFSKPDELVAHMLSGTFPTAVACSEFPRQLRFVGFEVDVDCFTASTEVLIETYERQILSEK